MSKLFSTLASALPALLILLLFGFLIFSNVGEDTPKETQVPLEVIQIEEPLPLTIINEQGDVASSEEVIEQEATQFVEKLAAESNPDTPIIVNEKEDQFILSDSQITLPKSRDKEINLNDLAQVKDYSDTTQLTLSYQDNNNDIAPNLFDSEGLNMSIDTPDGWTLNQVLNETSLSELQNILPDHQEEITIINSSGTTIKQDLKTLLSPISGINKDEKITIISQQEYSTTLPFSKLKSLTLDPSQKVTVSLPEQEQKINISEIIPKDEQRDDALFYVHRVTNEDSQGLWGIIQSGLIDKFRQGLRISGIGHNKELAQAIIPNDADERLNSGISSFFGKFLKDKVDSSYIYNFKSKTMGQDANLIHPGQQLVLIQFSGDELKQIYHYFSQQRNQGIETFGIAD